MYNMYRQTQSKNQTPRKLDRRNASRDIDYEATSFSPSTSFDASALHRSSFRVKGVDGEFDLIFRSLGLSGPDDFAIPASAWEARRSSSSFDRVSDVHNEIDNVCTDDVAVCIDDRDFEKFRVIDSSPLNSDGNSENFSANDPVRGCGVLSTLECIDQLNNNPISRRFEVNDSNNNNNISSRGEMKIRVTENERSENRFTPCKLNIRVEETNKLHDRYNLIELRVSDSDRNNYLSSSDEGENRVKGNNNSDDGTSIGLNPAILEAGVRRNNELENIDEISSELGDHQNLVELITNSDSDNLSETFKPELGIGEKKGNEKGLGSFSPQNDVDTGSYQKEMAVEGSEEVEGRIVGRGDVDGEWLGDIIVVSESCSHASDNKDDDSNVTQEHLLLVSPFNFKINSWQKGDFLGSGSFGTVFEGYTEDGIFFAVKEVSLLDQGDQAKQSIYQLEQEIFFLSQFQHDNIVQYLGTEKDNDKLYIFLELVTKGSLASLYQKYNLQDSQVSAYTRQILSGLNYLHLRKVVHRDIKCANILVDASGSVKLADFGLAKAANLNDLKSCKGTAFWMAPEVVNRKNHGYGLAADIWSLGCTVLEMLTRRIPYSHLEGMQALFRIGKGEPPPIPSSLSSEARDFISKCLQVNPDDRPTAAQLLDHPFVKRPLPTFSAHASPFHNGRRS